MKIEYHNLYTHFIFTTMNRFAIILEENRAQIEKYITGVVNNLDSKMYSIYANPDHVHMLISRSPKISEEEIATIVAQSTQKFINENMIICLAQQVTMNFTDLNIFVKVADVQKN